MLTVLCHCLANDAFGVAACKECGRWGRDLGIHDWQGRGSDKWRYFDLFYTPY